MSKYQSGKRQPYMAGCRGMGMGMPARRKAMQVDQILAGGTQLLGINGAQTFVRATSAWDPATSQIRPPGYLRTKGGAISPTLTSRAALIESPATNLLAAVGMTTENSLAGWAGPNNVIVNNAITAPDGESSGISVTRGNGTANAYVSTPNVSFTAGVTYTISVFAKAKSTGNMLGLRLQSTYPHKADMMVNLLTGQVFATAINTWTGLSTLVVPVGNGWYRCSLTATCDATIATGIAIWGPTDSANSAGGWEGFAGGTVDDCYTWGAQLEQAAFPSSYISNRNLQTQTQRYDNATWTKTDTTITQAAITGPLSGLTDGQLVAEGVAGTGALLNIGVLVTASGAYSTSAYFKRGNHDFILLQASNGAITSGFRQWFNINLGTAGTSQAFGTGTFTGGTITNVGGGWYRISISGTIGAFTSFVQTSQSASADASATRVNNAQRYMYGSQTEPGTTATAYWGVNGTVGGRDADNLTVNLAGLAGGGLSTTAGTLVALFSPLGWTGNDGGSAFLYDDSTTSGIAAAYILATGIAHVRRKDSVGVQDSPGTAATPSRGALEVVANVWDGAHVTTYVNGVAGTPTATTPPYVLSTGLQVGASQGNANALNGYVSLFYIPRALSAAEITALAVAAGF